MKKNTLVSMKALFISALFLMLFKNSEATHISGGDLTYKSLGGFNYEITLVLYRDCAGIPVQNPEAIRCVSASGAVVNFNVSLIPGTGNEITFPCFATPTTCGGGTNPGYQRYEYRGTVNLPASTNWNLKWVDCCRNCPITTTVGGCSDDFLIDANLNNSLAPGDNSPVFTNYPVSLVCLGQNFTYNHGVTDVEGDSLVYSFINPRRSSGAPISFNAGYSATSFLTSSTPITLNTFTGDINFTPAMMEIGITAISIQSYRNGQLIGSVMRDIQFVVQNCNPNILPTATGINGTNDFDTLICAGTPLCFDIFTNDANPGQVLTLTWNQAIPGATFTTTSDSFPVGTFCWTPTQEFARTQPYSFTVTVKDDNCAYNAFQVYSYQIFVPFVPLDSSISEPRCDTSERGSIYLTESAVGMPFQWQWSNGATTSSLTGLLPGTYSVIVTNTIGCQATKDFIIHPAPPKLAVNCLLTDSASTLTSADGVLEAIASGGTPPYSYLWSNGSTSMVNSGLISGNYAVTVTDTFGCSATSQCRVLTLCPSIYCSGYTSSCQGQNNAGASVIITGDTTGVRVVWNRNTSLTTTSIRNLSPGTYTAVVSNSNGCLDSCSVTIPSGPCGGFRTFTQGGWGALPAGKNAATYLKNKFRTVFPTGLTIGCVNRLTLTTWQAVVDFLPSGSIPSALPAGTLTNPGSAYQNVLAGQLVAATLNVKFDSADTRFAVSNLSLGDLVIVSGIFTGMTVNQLIDEANRKIGGCASRYSFSDLNNALDLVNRNYNNGELTGAVYVNYCYLGCPVSGSDGLLRFSMEDQTPYDVDNWNIYPNPASEKTIIAYNAELEGTVQVNMYSIQGVQVMKQFVYEVQYGSPVQIEVPIVDLMNGIYLVDISVNGERVVKRLMVFHR